MLKIEKLSFSFPNKILFEDVSFEVDAGNHCAFIGVSGAGKSTLIEMIRDDERYLYDGKIIRSEDCIIGYIDQIISKDAVKDKTVFEYIAAEYASILTEIEVVCEAMATADDVTPLLEKYQALLDAQDAFGGEDYESVIHKQLYTAGLSNHKDLPITSLSGGEFKLVDIIREMLKRPELLIMDEPDGFLDFENLVALSHLINQFKGTLIVVTHNRFLLNHCFNKMLHLENTKINSFKGNFIEYNFELLKDKIEKQEQALKDEAEIERNEALINRLRKIATYNTEAARGKSLRARVKIQERLEARKTVQPFVAMKQPKIALSSETLDITAPLLSIHDLSFRYEDAPQDELLFDRVSFDIHAGEKVALIGANGIGKTTLMKIIYSVDNHAIKHHPESSYAYLSQNQNELLNDDATVIDTFFASGCDTLDEVLGAISGYGFNSDVLEQKIGALSGGEKTLLQLAYVASQSANLLLLDEPTSHLDTYAQTAFENAIKAYPGAVLMISHDYYTIANCVDYVLLMADNTVRKISNRKFRKMIYQSHFSKDYLALDEQKKMLEYRIEHALKRHDFEEAKKIAELLEPIVAAIARC